MSTGQLIAITGTIAIITDRPGLSGPLGTTVTVCRSLWRRFLGVSLD
jgi:hypothetical protein